MTASTALGFDQSDPGEEYDPYPDFGDEFTNLVGHTARVNHRDLEVYECGLEQDLELSTVAAYLRGSYALETLWPSRLHAMYWTPSRYVGDYIHEWVDIDSKPLRWAEYFQDATCVILRLAVRQAIEMQMAEDVSDEVEDELEDYSPTRASCAFGRDVRRATVRKMELWMLDDCKEDDRMRRGGCWKRSDRNKRQWERGVIRAQRLAMRPRQVVIQHLKWSKWGEFGMVATVTDRTFVDGKIRIAPSSSQWGYIRPRPLDHELEEMDAQQEQAIDEMEAELSEPDLGWDLLSDWHLEGYEDEYVESLRRVLDREGSMTPDTWFWHRAMLRQIEQENGPEYDYEAEGSMSSDWDDDYDYGLDDSWDDACGSDCQCWDCLADMRDESDYHDSDEDWDMDEGDFPPCLDLVEDPDDGIDQDGHDRFDPDCQCDDCQTILYEQIDRERDPADDVYLDEDEVLDPEDWGLEARLMLGMGRPRRHSKIQRGPQWAKHKPGFNPRRAIRW
ncbi:MAG: hypothetical protein HQ488_01885 [Parcubacteria group bacterium]|nr:hypothetical protein [Parcubacteria group bacterium]